MARARSALLSDLIALVAVVATTVVALVSLWFNTRQSEKQFQRDLIKQDQAELRAVLDATTATAARVGGELRAPCEQLDTRWTDLKVSPRTRAR